MPKIDLRRHAPVIVIVALVAAPLAIWAATSGGSGNGTKKGLIAERSVSLTGAPEIILSIAGNVQVTSGASTVSVLTLISSTIPLLVCLVHVPTSPLSGSAFSTAPTGSVTGTQPTDRSAATRPNAISERAM